MLTEQNTIYPAIHTSIDEQIEKIFAPSKDEILFAETNTANKKYQLLLLTLLRSYQIYRRFIPLIDLPFDIIHYIYQMSIMIAGRIASS